MSQTSTAAAPRAASAPRAGLASLRTASLGTLRVVGDAVMTLVIVLAVWVGALAVFEVSPYVGKGPREVWEYLVEVPKAAANRAEIVTLLGETLRDASLGFVTGMVGALVLAAAIVLSRGVEATVMPVAMLLRSVPLIALAPIIFLLLGRGAVTVAVMSGIVVLFPRS